MTSLSYLIIFLIITPILTSIPITISWYLKPTVEYRLNRYLTILAVIGLGVSAIISTYILLNVKKLLFIEFPWIPELNISFRFIIDYLSKYMGVVTAWLAFFIGIYGLEYMAHDYRLGWYWFFYNLFTSSMLMTVYSDNLISLLLGWEGLGIASWGLIGHWFRDDDELTYVGIANRYLWKFKMWWVPSIGGFRAIATVRFGDMFMIFAIASIYVLTGTLNISEIPWIEIFKKIGPIGFTLIFICFMLGPFTKSAQLPFTDWLLTAMTGPTTVSALLHSATMVAAGAYVFMRISWYLKPWEYSIVKHHEHTLTIVGIEHSFGMTLQTIYTFILFLGLLTAFLASLWALGMLERKALLAASTAASLGLMFASTATCYWVGIVGIFVGFWYLIVHAFSKATLFLVAGHLIHVTHTRFSVGNTEMIKIVKPGFIATIIATISLAGIPPLTAYWIKAAMDHVMHEVSIEATILLILTSIVYSAFLAKFLSLNFIKGEKIHVHEIHGGLVMASAYMITALIILALLYFPIIKYPKVFYHHGLEISGISVGLLCTLTYAIAFIKPRIEQLSKIGTILSDRTYLPIVYDYVIPTIGKGLSIAVDYVNLGIDWFSHKAMPTLFQTLSYNIRRIQTGFLSTYLRYILALLITITLLTFLLLTYLLW